MILVALTEPPALGATLPFVTPTATVAGWVVVAVVVAGLPSDLKVDKGAVGLVPESIFAFDTDAVVDLATATFADGAATGVIFTA